MHDMGGHPAIPAGVFGAHMLGAGEFSLSYTPMFMRHEPELHRIFDGIARVYRDANPLCSVRRLNDEAADAAHRAASMDDRGATCFTRCTASPTPQSSWSWEITSIKA